MENLNKQIQELQKIIDTYDNIVFFGGAGVSTESGIPDFRSVDGLYHQQYDYPPETILSHTFYRSHTEEFFRFYRNKMLFPNAQPNAAHKKTGRTGSCRESPGRDHPEYRRTASGCRKQDCPGASRLRASQLL